MTYPSTKDITAEPLLPAPLIEKHDEQIPLILPTPRGLDLHWQEGVRFGVAAGFYLALVGFIALQILANNVRRLAGSLDQAESHRAILAVYGKIAISFVVLALSAFLFLSAQFG